MGDGVWRLFYESDLQALYAPVVVPAAFLVYLLAARTPRALAARSPEARFLYRWAVIFCIETVLDPLATGPGVEALDPGESAASALMILFVLLGDFRVFALVFGLALAQRLLRRRLAFAAAATLVVPIVAVSADAFVAWLRPEGAAQRLWLIYELAFLAMALLLRARWIPRWTDDRPALAQRLRAVLAYVAVYYGLWAASDLLILYAGADAGWLLRALPNQLYYAFFVPFAYAVLSRP